MNTLGRFQLLVELARGGMGIVYLARSVGVGGFSKLHIVKELKPEFVDDGTFLSMFIEEARLSARLEHPNIVQTIEVGRDGNRHFMAMEYLKGQSLERIWKRCRDSLSTNGLLRVLTEVLRGLDYAHTLKDYDGSDLGLVHRDVSPSNVFVTYDGEVKVLDFGIAKAADTELETKAGTVKGKAAYMSPEQLTGRTDLDGRADVFCVGVMVWESIAGRRLWEGLSEIDVVRCLLAGDIPDIRSIKPEVPEALAGICARALAIDPAERTPSADALRLEIEAYLAEQNEPVPSLRDIGQMVATAFASQRQELHRLIETTIQGLNADSNRALAVASSSIFSTSTGPGRETSSNFTPAGVIEQSGLVAPSGWRGASVFAGLVIVGAIVAGAMFVLPKNRNEAARTPEVAATPSAPVPVPVPPPQAAPAEQRTFAVVVNVSPSNAQIMANGRRTQSPATARCTAGELLSFAMSAQGYVSKSREVLCDSDHTIDVALDRVEAPYVQSHFGAQAAKLPSTPAPGTTTENSTPTTSTPAAPPPTVDCAVPFTIDAFGIRHPKPGC